MNFHSICRLIWARRNSVNLSTSATLMTGALMLMQKQYEQNIDTISRLVERLEKAKKSAQQDNPTSEMNDGGNFSEMNDGDNFIDMSSQFENTLDVVTPEGQQGQPIIHQDIPEGDGRTTETTDGDMASYFEENPDTVTLEGQEGQDIPTRDISKDVSHGDGCSQTQSDAEIPHTEVSSRRGDPGRRAPPSGSRRQRPPQGSKDKGIMEPRRSKDLGRQKTPEGQPVIHQDMPEGDGRTTETTDGDMASYFEENPDTVTLEGQEGQEGQDIPTRDISKDVSHGDGCSQTQSDAEIPHTEVSSRRGDPGRRAPPSGSRRQRPPQGSKDKGIMEPRRSKDLGRQKTPTVSGQNNRGTTEEGIQAGNPSDTNSPPQRSLGALAIEGNGDDSGAQDRTTRPRRHAGTGVDGQGDNGNGSGARGRARRSQRRVVSREAFNRDDLVARRPGLRSKRPEPGMYKEVEAPPTKRARKQPARQPTNVVPHTAHPAPHTGSEEQVPPMALTSTNPMVQSHSSSASSSGQARNVEQHSFKGHDLVLLEIDRRSSTFLRNLTTNISLYEFCVGLSREDAAGVFYLICDLANRGDIEVTQIVAYGDIIICKAT
ncbi:spore wall protein 2-like isoform X2 [Salvia hispanica]|nr:spore wall protein 2-like isoform X2 [Salvia hispanica]